MNALDAFNQNRSNAFDQQQGLQDLVTNRQAGAKLAGGDYQGAAGALYGAGNLNAGQAVQNYGQAQDDRTKKQADDKRAEELTFLHDAASLLAKVPDNTPNHDTRRQALVQHILPALKAQGADDQMLSQLAQSPLDDQTLAAFGAQLQAAIKGVVAGPGSQLLDPSTGHTMAQVPFAPNYQKLGPGESLVEANAPPAGTNAPASQNPQGATGGPQPRASGDFGQFWNQYLAPAEGGYAASDGNGKPVNFGINQGANPDVNVANLTAQQASQIAHDRYWVPSGADKLPPGLAEIQADTAFNMGVKAAQNLLQQSGGDPSKYLQLREQRYRSIAQADPSKAQFLPTWLDRNQKLAQYVGAGGGADQANGAQQAPAGLAGGSATPGVRVLVQGQAPKPEWSSDGQGNLINTKTGDRKVDPTAPGGGGPPTDPGLVRALSEGRMAFPSGMALSKPYWQKALQDVAAYDPSFDAANPTARTKTRTDFTSGQAARNIRALNTAIGHLGTLESQIKGTNGLGGFPGATTLNMGLNTLAKSSGSPGVTNFDQTASALATELTAVFRGTGGAEADVKRYLGQLDSNASTAQKKAAVKNISELLNSRLESLSSQYQAGMGVVKDPMQFLTPDKAAVFQRLTGNVPTKTAPTTQRPPLSAIFK